MSEPTEQQERPKAWRVKCAIFSRVVGYYAPLDNWNAGKVAEFNQRRTYSVPTAGQLEQLGAKEP